MPLARAINHAHPAAANLVEDLVIPDEALAFPRFHFRDHALESFARIGLFVFQPRAEETIETAAVIHSRDRPAIRTTLRRLLDDSGNGIANGSRLHR